MESSLYVGHLRHRRFNPAKHEFTYPLFMAFLDIDRLPELMKVSPFTGYDRWNWASFHEADHFGEASKTLRERVSRSAWQSGLELPDGPIFLLTHLRYLGYNFNPVSFFYCYDSDKHLQLILAEVHNTFGEYENYWLNPMCEEAAGANKKYRFPKSFHVSPFMEQRQEYEWTFTPPSERLVAECVTHENGHSIFDSTLKLEQRQWSRVELHRTLARFPWVTGKVVAGIYWQALKLMMKRVPVVPHPGAGKFKRSTTQHMGASWRTEQHR
ncbi:MAG TPA: DUF1365 domain-containing protein [Terriglobales bacterium]|jgi:hypothetical protein|nr:DUF1365 domain-containing protein [Terriglobales bacterium]